MTESRLLVKIGDKYVIVRMHGDTDGIEQLVAHIQDKFEAEADTIQHITPTWFHSHGIKHDKE